MGNASSKAARRLPRHTGGDSPSLTSSNASRAFPHRPPIAKEQKDQVIDEDSKDPQFLSNLSRLGPVVVDHHMEAVRPAQKSRQMLESRVQSEVEAYSMQTTRNRIHASTLSYLLDKSKSTASRSEMTELADKYGLDIEKLESVSRYVASPSIQGNSVVRTVRNEDGEEEFSVVAIWAQPKFS